jgi:predicted transcriptional regulator
VKARFAAAVEEGLENAEAGRLRDHEEVVARTRQRFGSKSRR